MFIDEKYAAPIREWVLNRENREQFLHDPDMKGVQSVCGLPHSQNEDRLRVKAKFPYVEMFRVWQQILSYYGLPKTQELDGEFGALISYSEAGHKVQPHKDPNPPRKTHTRFNVLISKSDKGGEAIIDGSIVPTEVNEVWVCAAGKFTHSSVTTEGETPRILLSYGTYLKDKELTKVLNINK